jgi:hypothetical protein
LGSERNITVEARPRSLPDQWSSSASPPCSSKFLYASSPNTPRYCLLLCPGLKECLLLHSLTTWKSTCPNTKVWTGHLDLGSKFYSILSPPKKALNCFRILIRGNIRIRRILSSLEPSFLSPGQDLNM